MTIKRIKRVKSDDIIAIIYILGFTLRFFSNINKTITALLWIISGILTIGYCYVKKKSLRKPILVFLLIMLVSYINGVINGNGGHLFFLFNLASGSFGFLLYLKKNSLQLVHFAFSVMFWWLVVYVLMYYFSGNTNDIYINDLNVKNTINIIMLLCCFIDLLYRIQEQKQIVYYPYIVGIITSFFYDSSGGILGFLVLLFGIFLCSKNKDKISKIKLAISALSGIVIVISFYQIILEFLGDDNSRFWIWGAYYSLIESNFKNLLFGSNFYPIEELYRIKNVHCNFFNWHAFYGLIPFVFYSSIVIWEIIKCFVLKHWYYFFFCLTIFVRSITDATDFAFLSIWVFLWIELSSDKYKTQILAPPKIKLET